MDKSSFAGLLIGIGGIVAGLLLEGGKLAQVLQPTAAIIVFGGTLGAVLLQYPMPVVGAAFRRLIQVFFARTNPTGPCSLEMTCAVNLAKPCTRDGNGST